MTATTSPNLQNGYITDTSKYAECKLAIYDEIDNMLTAEKRFQQIGEREEKSVFDAALVRKITKGKYATRWRGLSMMKDCFDVIIYEQLFWELQPRTIFEIGAYTGACALWMSDTMKAFKLPAHVYSVDINMDLVDPLASADENITFIEGNVKKIEETFPESLLQTCPHPWVISEDCHVDVVGVMEHFHKYMQKGDYFIIEDTSPDTPATSGACFLDDIDYQPWGKSKLHLMKVFLSKYNDFYRVDSYYTDFYGYNGTINWNGYIKRMK